MAIAFSNETAPLTDLKSARNRARKMGLHDVSRTILMCVDRKEAGCASSRQMSEAWKYLKRRTKELGLHKASGILRLKMQCCGLCKGGPIAVVMPDNVWYGKCDPDALEEIIQRHLLAGEIVTEHVIAEPVETS